MLNVARVVNNPRLTREFIVRRPGPSAFDATGVAVMDSYQDVPFRGVVQPATPKQLELLPSGTNEKDVISVWSTAEIRIDDSQGQMTDVMVIDGRSYRVTKLLDWGLNGYWQALCVGFAT